MLTAASKRHPITPLRSLLSNKAEMRARYCAGILIAAGMIGVAPPSAASPRQIACPSEISSLAVQVAAPPGWKAHVQSPLYLASAGMSAGPPESLAILRGEQLNRNGQTTSTRYQFGEIEVQHGKWLNCEYGADSTVTLSKRLDDSFKECTVSYLRQERPGKQNIQIVCK